MDWGARDLDETFELFTENWAKNTWKGDPKPQEAPWKDGPEAPAYKQNDFTDVYSKYGLKFTGNLATDDEETQFDFRTRI